MASLINLNKTVGTVVQAMTLVQSLTKVISAAVDVSKKLAGTVHVKFGRTAAASHGATVFAVENDPVGDGTSWQPVYTWTTNLHGSAPTTRDLSADAAAGATGIKMATGSLNSANSTPIAIYNSTTPSKSEIGFLVKDQQDPSLSWSLNTLQSANAVHVYSFAETWAIPLDFAGMNSIRFVADNVWNAVASPILVQAVIVTTDAASAT